MDDQELSQRSPNVVTGFMVRYAGPDDAFTTFQTFQPVDGKFYKVEWLQPVVFIPSPGFVIDDSILDAPVVYRGSQPFQLRDAIERSFVRIADRWENPIPINLTG